MTELYDAAIIGGGPAGLSAAIYLSRAGFQVIVLEKEGVGGQMASTYEVANYPGVLPTNGYDLAQIMREQAASFGTQFQTFHVGAMNFRREVWELLPERTDASAPPADDGGCCVRARGVILAMGAVPRKAGFEGERAFTGRGVSYCAACDGAFFRNREIFVVGGGTAAVEEGLFLTRFAKKVTLVIRRGQFSCPPSVYRRLSGNEKIEVLFHTQIIAVSGEDIVTEIRFCTRSADSPDPSAQEEWSRSAPEGFGVFVLAGRHPDTAWLPDDIQRDETGYLVTGEDLRTALPRVCAAGDVRKKKLRQIATAVSDGAIAATELEKQFS